MKQKSNETWPSLSTKSSVATCTNGCTLEHSQSQTVEDSFKTRCELACHAPPLT